MAIPAAKKQSIYGKSALNQRTLTYKRIHSVGRAAHDHTEADEGGTKDGDIATTD
jgi:hypothetical protein